MTLPEPAAPILKTSAAALRRVVGTLADGGVVIIPTDTFYGLAVDSDNQAAVRRLYSLKARDRGKPLILLVPDFERAAGLARDPSPKALKLAERLWPGPVTVIFKAGDKVPVEITGGSGTVGLRVPDRRATLKLLGLWNGPLTAPSANAQGRPAAADVGEIEPDLLGKVDLVIDDGALPGGAPSTLVDVTVWPPVVVRPGAVPESRIMELVRAID